MHFSFIGLTLSTSSLSSADWIKESSNATEAKTIQLRQHIHQHPELGNMEYETSKLVQKELLPLFAFFDQAVAQ